MRVGPRPGVGRVDEMEVLVAGRLTLVLDDVDSRGRIPSRREVVDAWRVHRALFGTGLRRSDDVAPAREHTGQQDARHDR